MPSAYVWPSETTRPRIFSQYMCVYSRDHFLQSLALEWTGFRIGSLSKIVRHDLGLQAVYGLEVNRL
jgi:hypothetical protein